MVLWPIDLVTVFLIGLFSSLGHCIGMCGGFVMTYSLKIHREPPRGGLSRWTQLLPHLLYNGGRIFTYMLLGLFFGALGETLKIIVEIRRFQGSVEVFAGLMMIVMGLDLGGWLPISRGAYFPGYHTFKRGLNHLLERVNRRNVFQLGMILGFIPCGLVYAAGAKAAATGNAFSGMLIMLFFGLGTVPALLLVGVGANLISVRWRNQLFRLAALLVIVLGIVTVMRGVSALRSEGATPHLHRHSAVERASPPENGKGVVLDEICSIFKTLKSQKLI